MFKFVINGITEIDNIEPDELDFWKDVMKGNMLLPDVQYEIVGY